MISRILKIFLYVALLFNNISANLISSDIRLNNANKITMNEKNTVTIRGKITGETATQFGNSFNKLLKQPQINVFISSGGGSVTSGMEIVRHITTAEKKGKKIKCIADIAISMAFVIFQYCPERYILVGSVLMQHQMTISMGGPINNVRSLLSFYEAMEHDLGTHQANKLNITLEEFKNKTVNDWWLYNNDIIKHKAADKYALATCKYKNKEITEILRTFFGPIEIVYSSCPLFRSPLRIKFGRKDFYEAFNNETYDYFRNNIEKDIDMNVYMEKKFNNLFHK
jgi:Protease subunit of ATP-dependent Clp proteases